MFGKGLALTQNIGDWINNVQTGRIPQTQMASSSAQKAFLQLQMGCLLEADIIFHIHSLSITEGAEQLTALQEACCSVLNLLGQLTRAFQVVEDEDVGSKQHHVLLPTAVRHGQELVQVLHGPAHQVTCSSNRTKMSQMPKLHPVKIQLLADLTVTI